MKKHLWLLMVIPILILALNGCGKVQSTGNETTLQLNGFPYDITTYDLKVYIRKSDQLLKVYSFTGQSVTQEFNEKISVDPTATSLTAYLYSEAEPQYFAYFGYTTAKTTYSSSYWIKYDSYFDNGTVDFGISEGIATVVDSSYEGSIDFSENLYGLFKVSNATDQSISINITSPDSPVCISSSPTLEGLNFNDYWSYYNLNQIIAPSQNDVYYIYIRPTTLTVPLPTAQISINCIKQVSVSSRIVDMVAGNTPDVVYAVDNSGKIFSINPVTKVIGTQYSLSVSPVALAFSSVDNLLYILDADSGQFQIWDPVSNTSVSVVTFGSSSYSDYGREIQVMPNNNRIYALIDYKLYVIDTNSLDPISNISTPNANSMIVYEDGNNETIFISQSYSLAQYSFDSINSTLNSGPTRNINYGSTKMIISPDKTKLVTPDIDVSGYVNAYNPNDLTGTLLGQWNIGNYPKVACFSPDSSIGYFVNGDDDYYDDDLVIDVMDAEDYSLIRKLGLPYADEYPLITTNQDGSKLIAYSGYYSDTFRLYFYENIKKTSLTQSSRIYPLNVKAIRSKANAAILRLETN